MADNNFQKRRVLVVDDEPLVCDAVRMLLTVDGYLVETAGDGDQALAKFEVGKFDLVLVDYQMPKMRGDELAVILKERAPCQPILLLTAHGELLRASGRPLTGIDLIVDKPFRLEALRAGIARVLASYSKI